MIKVRVEGNLTADATINSLSDKQDAVNIRVAVNRQYRDSEGNYVDLPVAYVSCFIPVNKGNGAKLAEKLTQGRNMTFLCGIRKRTNNKPDKEGITHHQCTYPVSRIIEWGALPKPKAA